MTESNVPALFNTATLPALPDDKALDAVASTSFLPRIQLMTSNSAQCKSGKIPINTYVLVRGGQNFVQLGQSVDVIPLHWRAKALRTTGGEVVISYDAESPLFMAIKERSAQKNSGCMYGPEFLLWVPQSKCFATLFMGSVSARREARNLSQFNRQAATLYSTMLKNAKYEWAAIAVKGCSTPIDDLPEVEACGLEIERFSHPTETEAVPVDTVAAARER